MDGSSSKWRGSKSIPYERDSSRSGPCNPRLSLFSSNKQGYSGDSYLQHNPEPMAPHTPLFNDVRASSNGSERRDSHLPVSVHGGGLCDGSDSIRSNSGGGKRKSVSKSRENGNPEQLNVPNGHWESFTETITESAVARIRQGDAVQELDGKEPSNSEEFGTSFTLATRLQRKMIKKYNDDFDAGLIDLGDTKQVAAISTLIRDVHSTQIKVTDTVYKKQDADRRTKVLEELSRALAQSTAPSILDLEMDD